MTANEPVFMKDWNLEYKSSALALSSIVIPMLNYLRPPVFHKYYVSGCRFFRQLSIHEQTIQQSIYFAESCRWTDLTKSTETPAMSAI
jgi:hypothetical protein